MLQNYNKNEYSEFINSIDLNVLELTQKKLILVSGGMVSHGKSTVIKMLTNIDPIRHKAEKQRNITIVIGYATFKIYKNNDTDELIYDYNLTTPKETYQNNNLTLIRDIMFCDLPGHNEYITTTLCGINSAESIIFIVAANEPCPQPQTIEHLLAIEIMIKNSPKNKNNRIIILQNKLDLVSKEQAIEHYKQIKNFVKGTIAENAPIIPICAQKKINMDLVVDYIANYFPIPRRNLHLPPILTIIRSFDVNKPGTEFNELNGGVCGGNITQGIFKIGHEVEIKPGLISKNEKGLIEHKTLYTTITSLFVDTTKLEIATSGNLIGMGTNLDPILTKENRLVGQFIGLVGSLPNVYYNLKIKYTLLNTINDIQTLENIFAISDKQLYLNEVLQLNIGVTNVFCMITSLESSQTDCFKFDLNPLKSNDNALSTVNISQQYTSQLIMNVKLQLPICAFDYETIIILRNISNHYRLVGYGKMC
jgi:translation initiation factor 2 subunit 3